MRRLHLAPQIILALGLLLITTKQSEAADRADSTTPSALSSSVTR